MPNAPETAGARLRRSVSARRALLVPGVMNALAARVADDLGFEAMYVTGAGVTNAHLGLPDSAFLGLTDLVDHVAAIRDVTDRPLIVDADTGFGNAVNVWHCVRRLERAGANAIQLEDQAMPKRCGHFEGKTVVDASEMAEKVRAACEARSTDDLLVIARTDAYASEGLEAALLRAERYVAAGADLTFVEAPRRVEEVAEIVRRLSVPQLVNMVIGGKTPPIPQASLGDLGVGLVLYANAALQGAIAGMQRALSALQADGRLTEAEGLVASFAERQRLVGKPLLDGLEARYAAKPDTAL